VTERVFPLIETDAAPVIAELLGSAIVRSELVDGGLSNTLRRVELADGRVLGVKQYVLGRSYAAEGAALRAIGCAVPVPEIVCTLDRVIAYRWIDGATLTTDRLPDARIPDALAAPLGGILAALAQVGRRAKPLDLAPVFARLEHGQARERLGPARADALRARLEAYRFDEPMCLIHGDFGRRNVIVAPSMDRIAGVIDWEAATTGSPLSDVGSLFRHAKRPDDAFRAAFERAHGGFPHDWYPRARLLDAARMVATLAEDPTTRAYHAELRALIDEIIASTAR
jgi:aminoglycoside phosphotransferase (APT) family kinase protein